MASPPSESSTGHPTDETAVAASAGNDASDAPVDDLGVDELLLDAADEEPAAEDETPADELSAAGELSADEPGAGGPGGIAGDWDTDSDVPLVDWDGTAMDVPPDRRGPRSDGEDEWGGTDWDGTEWDGLDVAPSEATRLRRRKWRRRRRALGTLLFLLVVTGLGFVVARAAGVGEDDGSVESAPTTTAPSTTTTLPPAGPYKVLDGLNVRSAPSSTATVLGTIKVGETVMVACVTEGDLVRGPNGQSTKWLQVPTPFGPVFVTAAYVAVGADLANSAKIAPCTA